MRELLLAAAPAFFGSALVCAPAALWVARMRQRRLLPWLVFGLLIGPAAVAILLVAPPGRCPRCQAPVSGWRTLCAECGFSLEGDDSADASYAPASTTPARPAPVVTLIDAKPAREPVPLPTAAWRTEPAASASVPAPGNGSAPRSIFERVGAVRPVATNAAPSATIPQAAPPASAAPSAAAAPTGPAPAGHQPPVPRPAPPLGPAPLPSIATPAPSSPEPEAPSSEEILATGVFISGSSGMLSGARYELVRVGNELVVRGPLDETPHHVRARRAIDDLEATAMQDDLLISTRPGRTPPLVLGFRGVRGRSIPHMESLFGTSTSVAVEEPPENDTRPGDREDPEQASEEAGTEDGEGARKAAADPEAATAVPVETAAEEPASDRERVVAAGAEPRPRVATPGRRVSRSRSHPASTETSTAAAAEVATPTPETLPTADPQTAEERPDAGKATERRRRASATRAGAATDGHRSARKAASG